MATAKIRMTANDKNMKLRRENFHLRCLNSEAAVRQLREVFQAAGEDYSLDIKDCTLELWKFAENEPVKVGEFYIQMDDEPAGAVYMKPGIEELKSELF